MVELYKLFLIANNDNIKIYRISRKRKYSDALF